MVTDGVLNGESFIEVSDYHPKYLGCLWDGTIFRKLAISVDSPALVLNTPTNVTIQWVDVDGNPISYGEDVELHCGNVVEVVTIVNGRGTTTFESAEPGEFTLVAVSPAGVEAHCKVVVL